MTVLATSCKRTSLSVTSDVDMVLLSSESKSTLKCSNVKVSGGITNGHFAPCKNNLSGSLN